MIRRYEELDSLRGIAALMVLIGHFVSVTPLVSPEIRSYLSILWSGHSAVIFFFVLSGFVLSLPFYQKTEFNYFKYMIKRFCRIYIPYIVILFIAIVVKISLESKIGSISVLRGWGSWEEEVSLINIIQHILFLGEYKFETYVMSVWTLVHEMRISIIFPLVVFLVIKLNWRSSLALAFFVSVAGYLLMQTFPSDPNTPVSLNYFITLHYIGMFIIGALLAKNREFIINNVVRSKFKYLLLPVGILFFCYPRIPFMFLSKIIGNTEFNLYLILIDWYITFGAVLILVASLSIKSVSSFLFLKPIRFFGKISYSLYLVHAVALLAMIHLLFGLVPIPIILLISFILTIVLSWVCYEYIEKPSMKLGKYLSRNKTVEPVQKEEVSI